MPTYEVEIRVEAEDSIAIYSQDRDESQRRFVRSIQASSPQAAMHAAAVWATDKLAEETLLG